jgi:hypothetical protein
MHGIQKPLIEGKTNPLRFRIISLMHFAIVSIALFREENFHTPMKIFQLNNFAEKYMEVRKCWEFTKVTEDISRLQLGVYV